MDPTTPASPQDAAQADADTAPALLQVACLCAAWCRTCEGYAGVFEAAMAQLRALQPQLQLQAHWIDIEDQAELLGDVDVQTFPTLVVAHGGRLLFAGPLTPQPETLQRMLRAALSGQQAAATDPEFEAFAQRLAAVGR